MTETPWPTLERFVARSRRYVSDIRQELDDRLERLSRPPRTRADEAYRRHRCCFICNEVRRGDALIGVKYCKGCCLADGVSLTLRPFLFDFLYVADSTVFAPRSVIRDRLYGLTPMKPTAFARAYPGVIRALAGLAK